MTKKKSSHASITNDCQVKRKINHEDDVDIGKKSSNKKAKYSNGTQEAKLIPSDMRNEKYLHLFSELLGGMPMEKFLNNYFEKDILHVKSHLNKEILANSYFSREVLIQTLEEYSNLTFQRDFTVCKYTNNERENYTPPDEASSINSSEKVAELFQKGYSCQFYQPQRYSDTLCQVNTALESLFGSLAGSSAYLTPSNAQALAPHHDDVDVFILQTEGRKSWKLYKPLVELAGEHSNDLDIQDIGEVWKEITLEQGDVLYFPRGVIHQAKTDSKHFSTHVTFSIYQHHSWANYLEVAFPRIIRRAFDENIEFRRGLPSNYLNFMGTQYQEKLQDKKMVEQFKQTCKNLLQSLADSLKVEDLHGAADDASNDFIANRLPPMENNDEVDDPSVEPLLKNTKLRWKYREHVRLVINSDGQENGEMVATILYSSNNCQIHHMGICRCSSTDENSDEEEEEEDEEKLHESMKEDDNKDGAEMSDIDQISDLQGPPQPMSLAFPGKLAAPILSLFTEYPAFVTVEELIKCYSSNPEEEQEMAVRGALTQLLSEELLEMKNEEK